MSSSREEAYTVEEVSVFGNRKKTLSRPGMYIAKAPMAAASKAFNKLCKLNKQKKECVNYLTVQKKSTGKIYRYKATRVYSPVTIKRGKEIVTFKYKTQIHKTL